MSFIFLSCFPYLICFFCDNDPWKLSSIKLKRTSGVFTDLVTVCLHARTHTHIHSQTCSRAYARECVCVYVYANCVLLRKHVCVSFMNIILHRSAQPLLSCVRGKTRQGRQRRNEARCGETRRGKSKRGFVRRLQHTKNSFSIWL